MYVCMYVCMYVLYVRMSGDLLDVVEVDFIVDDELGDHLLLLLALEEQHNTTQHMSTQWSAAIEREMDEWMDENVGGRNLGHLLLPVECVVVDALLFPG